MNDYIDLTTGELIAVPQFRRAQRRTVKVYKHRKSVLGLSMFQLKALKNVSPIVIAGIVLAVSLMQVAR